MVRAGAPYATEARAIIIRLLEVLTALIRR